MKKTLLATVAAGAVLIALFEVDVDYRFTRPHTEERPDPQQEARYEACVERHDREIHAEAFARIDNPDVQREIIYRRMQEAKQLCRKAHPLRMTTVEVPFDFNLIDLRWRY